MKRPPCLPQSLPQSLGGRAEREQRRRRDADAGERKSEQEPHRAETLARNELVDAAAFAEAWEQGRTLTLAESVTLVVAEPLPS